MPPTLPARCRHLKTDGLQCNSPALRGQPLCFHHTTLRQPLPVKTLDGRTLPQLPAPDDLAAVQRGIAEVVRLLAEDEITDRRASTLLRGLALASQNLARLHRQEVRETAGRQTQETSTGPVTDLVNDPELGPLALAETPSGGEIPDQQNQDLSPFGEVFPETRTELGSEPEPVPTPATRFTPNAALTAADDEKIGAFYLQMEENFRDKRRAFIQEKTAELEAQFQHRLETQLEARLQTELQTRLAAERESRLPESPTRSTPELQLAAA